jgi:hypothetical protein
MKKTILTRRLEKIERLTRYAMLDKNTFKIRQGFHLMKRVKDELAVISTPKILHLKQA